MDFFLQNFGINSKMPENKTVPGSRQVFSGRIISLCKPLTIYSWGFEGFWEFKGFKQFSPWLKPVDLKSRKCRNARRVAKSRSRLKKQQRDLSE